MKASIIKKSIILIVIWMAAFAVMFLVHCIPSAYIQKNIEKSLDELKEEGLYPYVGNVDSDSFALDMYTEDAFLDMLYNSDSSRPVYSALANMQTEGNTGLQHLLNRIRMH